MLEEVIKGVDRAVINGVALAHRYNGWFALAVFEVEEFNA